MRPFKRVSPSQINSYNDCPRLWWYQSVLGLETPQRASAALGEAVHAQLEAYMDKGTLPDESTEAGSIAASGISLLPEPETCWTELKMHDDDIHFRWPPVVLSGIPVSGYIDLCDITVTPPLVLDHKTTSDLKWAKTEEELLCDPQMILYGSFVLGACDKQDIPTEEVETGHVVYLTRGARRARKTTVVLTREHLAREREKLEVTVDKMKVLALVRSPDEVPGEPNSCNNYGGCHFRDKCRALGLIGGPQTFAEYFREAPVPAPVNNNTTTTESPMSAIDPLAALKALKARNAAAAATRTEADTLPAKPSEPAAEAASSEEEQEVATEVATTVATAPDPDKAAARAALFAKYGIKAPEGASAATVASAVLSAVATEEPKAPEADSDEKKTVRRPQKYAEKLAALNWNEEQVARMSPEAMRAAIDDNLDGAKHSVRKDGSIFLPGVGPVEGKAEEPETEKDASGDVKCVEKVVEKEAASAPVTGRILPEPVGVRVGQNPPAPEPALTLYIDCWPEKGRDRDYLLLEDIIAGYQEEVVALHNKSAKDSEKADYYTLIPYNRGPGYVAMLLLKAPPVGAVVCNTRYPGTNACLEVLVPLADVVIRSR